MVFVGGSLSLGVAVQKDRDLDSDSFFWGGQGLESRSLLNLVFLGGVWQSQRVFEKIWVMCDG